MRFDLHIHSSYSPDGLVEPRDIIIAAKKNGLSGLCISDHNEVKAYRSAKETATEKGLILIRGIEISTTEGHLLAYGIDNHIDRGLTPTETIERIEAQGGICVIPHPYRFWSGIGGKNSRKLTVTGVEILNGRSPHPGNNKAKKLAKAMGLPGTGGSDAHSFSDIGKSWTVFNNPVSSEDEVLDSIRNGEVTVGGRGRDVKETVQYGTKVFSEWMKRGFKKI